MEKQGERFRKIGRKSKRRDGKLGRKKQRFSLARAIPSQL